VKRVFCYVLIAILLYFAINYSNFYIYFKFTFEIGGKGKSAKQLIGVEHAYLTVDDMEAGIGNKIPLQMFGLLYWFIKYL
jgi:hypothetical protein